MWEKLNTTLTLIIVLGIGVIGYMLYDWYQNADAGPTDQAGQTNSLLGAVRGTNSIDPATGQSTGVVNSVNNYLFPQTYPGGGETGAETYTGAASSTVESPYQTLKTLLGY